jgi:uncharacterized membrane protein YgaE (UPF0421/DUF939 family)
VRGGTVRFPGAHYFSQRKTDLKERNGINVKITRIDIEITLAIGICLLMAKVIPQFQAMIACITAIICVQNGVKDSLKASLIRLVITAIGGLTAIAVILVDNHILNTWLFIAMVMIGAMLTFIFCKLARVPAFNARIGGVTFILVVLTGAKNDKIYSALFRLLSTVYGAAIVILVSAIFSLFAWLKQSKLRKKIILKEECK